MCSSLRFRVTTFSCACTTDTSRERVRKSRRTESGPNLWQHLFFFLSFSSDHATIRILAAAKLTHAHRTRATLSLKLSLSLCCTITGKTVISRATIADENPLTESSVYLEVRMLLNLRANEA